MKQKEFDGGSNKPIQYCITVEAHEANGGWTGTARWRFKDGSVKVDLRIDNNGFSIQEIRVTHRNRFLAAAMELRAFSGDEVAYLEKCFRETIGL